MPATRRSRRSSSSSEEEYKEAREKYGDKFDASIGAEAIKVLLVRIDTKKKPTGCGRQ